MLEDKIIVPEHYKILANELKPLVKDIQNAFVNRPVPTGLYIDDISLFATLWFNPLAASIRNLTSELNTLGSLVFPDKEPAAYEIRQSVQSLSIALRRVIDIFHSIWNRPFSGQIADGQPLVSAVPERMLRECINVFEKIVDIVENPQEVMKKYGSLNVSLTITFGEEELNRLRAWMNTRGINLCCRTSQKKYGFETLALAFLLGWWIGDD